MGTANGWLSQPDPPRDGALAEVVLDWFGAGTPPANVVNELRAGFVVLEERQGGWALLGPDSDERVTYTETFDRAAVGMGT